jgi:cell division protein FtsB
LKKIISIIKNKYLITVIALAVWISFFDRNSIPVQMEFRSQVKKLQIERNYYLKEISSISSDLRELTTNVKTLEKFAREKYLMKRDNEDIYVIVEEKK